MDVILRYGENDFQCEAKIDTGAQYCLFSREIGEILGIDIESGIRREFRTLTGTLTAFGHELTIGTLGELFDATVYFAEEYNLPRTFLAAMAGFNLSASPSSTTTKNST